MKILKVYGNKKIINVLFCLFVFVGGGGYGLLELFETKTHIGLEQFSFNSKYHNNNFI